MFWLFFSDGLWAERTTTVPLYNIVQTGEANPLEYLWTGWGEFDTQYTETSFYISIPFVNLYEQTNPPRVVNVYNMVLFIIWNECSCCLHRLHCRKQQGNKDEGFWNNIEFCVLIIATTSLMVIKVMTTSTEKSYTKYIRMVSHEN